jgi:hypothetical protein
VEYLKGAFGYYLAYSAALDLAGKVCQANRHKHFSLLTPFVSYREKEFS